VAPISPRNPRGTPAPPDPSPTRSNSPARAAIPNRLCPSRSYLHEIP
jgi:hypothetical protein